MIRPNGSKNTAIIAYSVHTHVNERSKTNHTQGFNYLFRLENETHVRVCKVFLQFPT